MTVDQDVASPQQSFRAAVPLRSPAMLVKLFSFDFDFLRLLSRSWNIDYVYEIEARSAAQQQHPSAVV